MLLLRFILGVLLGCLERAAGAFVLCKVWTWWVVPFWPSAPPLTFLVAIGVGLVLSTVGMNFSVVQVRILEKVKGEEKDEWEDLAWSVAAICILWPFMLGIAWVFRWVLL